MPQDLADPWLEKFIIAIATASVMTWLFLIGRPRRWPFLAYELREPVPWGFAGAVLALLLLVTNSIEMGRSITAATPSENADAAPSAFDMGANVLLQLIIIGSFVLAVVVLSAAKPRDLGIDSLRLWLGRDIKVGIVACLAAFVPVFAIQALLFYLQETLTKHPLVTMVEHDPNWTTLAVVFVAAVLIAPVCEEITFRLLLQGWLEKWEDQKLGRRIVPTTAELDQLVDGESEATVPGVADMAVCEPPVETWEPPRIGLFGLPHGWAPILISSVAFALAHLGHGTDPIPLFPLAIILGYVYQRTHRVLPSIVAHALFNLATMVVLWRTVLHTGE